MVMIQPIVTDSISHDDLGQQEHCLQLLGGLHPLLMAPQHDAIVAISLGTTDIPNACNSEYGPSLQCWNNLDGWLRG